MSIFFHLTAPPSIFDIYQLLKIFFPLISKILCPITEAEAQLSIQEADLLSKPHFFNILLQERDNFDSLISHSLSQCLSSEEVRRQNLIH